MAYEWMLPLVALNSMSQPVKDRTTNPLLLTMLPVAPSMRGPIAAVAITQLGQDAINQEKTAIDNTVKAVGSAAAAPRGLAARDLEHLSSLAASDRQVVADRINDTVGDIAKAAFLEAKSIATAVLNQGNDALKDDELAKYPLIQRFFDRQTLLQYVSAMRADAATSAANPGTTEASATETTTTPPSKGAADTKPENGGSPKTSPGH